MLVEYIQVILIGAGVTAALVQYMAGPVALTVALILTF